MVPHGRLHIVLVPGFAGFDALGQLEYFAGVTGQFQAWQQGAREVRAVLHYFDNFPTAAVITRAGRLRNYLAKRIARREFQPGDSLALVGHSTGGLDIRWLLWELTGPGHQDILRGWRRRAGRRNLKDGPPPRLPLRAAVGHQHRRLGAQLQSRAYRGGGRTPHLGGRLATAPHRPPAGLRASRSQFPHRLEPGARPARRAQRSRSALLWRRSVAHRGCARSRIRARSLVAPHGLGFSRHRRSGFAGAARNLP